jgi:hypothetical protein
MLTRQKTRSRRWKRAGKNFPASGIAARIEGGHGDTRVGPLRVPFVVEGYSLRYCKPFHGFVDVLEPDGERIRGRATFRGREFGRFEMRRV